MTDTTKTLKAGQVYVGGYVDGRHGALIDVVGGTGHLTPEQCRQVAEYLKACADKAAADG